ncbi:unnamed protein product [Mytilus edulis]|uniref:Uncharacterized protein n=1 Tax=Mytilus edulis TaxID=6550 RepID=A0A8S3UKT3_MYTED|nr:unnamed protein product [Mytilus edulis]
MNQSSHFLLRINLAPLVPMKDVVMMEPTCNLLKSICRLMKPVESLNISQKLFGIRLASLESMSQSLTALRLQPWLENRYGNRHTETTRSGFLSSTANCEISRINGDRHIPGDIRYIMLGGLLIPECWDNIDINTESIDDFYREITVHSLIKNQDEQYVLGQVLIVIEKHPSCMSNEAVYVHAIQTFDQQLYVIAQTFILYKGKVNNS